MTEALLFSIINALCTCLHQLHMGLSLTRGPEKGRLVPGALAVSSAIRQNPAGAHSKFLVRAVSDRTFFE